MCSVAAAYDKARDDAACDGGSDGRVADGGGGSGGGGRSDSSAWGCESNATAAPAPVAVRLPMRFAPMAGGARAQGAAAFAPCVTTSLART